MVDLGPHVYDGDPGLPLTGNNELHERDVYIDTSSATHPLIKFSFGAGRPFSNSPSLMLNGSKLP